VDTRAFYVAALGFGTDDRLYVDNQNPEPNNLALTIFVNNGAPPTQLQFANDTATGSLPGRIDITLVGTASTSTFTSLEDWQSKLGITSAPFMTG